MRHRNDATRIDFSMPRPNEIEKTTRIRDDDGKGLPSTRIKANAIPTLTQVSSGSSGLGMSGWTTSWLMVDGVWD